MLPKNNSVRKGSLKLGRETITFSPWTNGQLIEFESLKDSLDKKSLQYKTELEKLKIDRLVKPNLSNDKKRNLFEYRLLFIEIYKLSKGVEFDFQFKCSHCDTYSEGIFNIEKSVSFSEMSSDSIETDKYQFEMKTTSKYSVLDSEEPVDVKGLKYIVSYVKSFTDGKETFEGFTLDELYDWFMQECPEKDYRQFMKEFKEIQPNLKIEDTYECEWCGKENFIQFKDIPDFIYCY